MRRAVPLAFALSAALLYVSSALATGGTSIANAPLVQPGVPSVGNTQTEPHASGSIGSELSVGCWNDVQYWRLKLKAGDEVSIVGKAPSPSNNFGIGIFPAGTTGRTLANAAAWSTAFPARGPIKYRAKTTGTYPVVIGPTCYDATDGPYTFTVTVTH